MAPDRNAVKILLIVNYFPPLSGGGRAYRAAKLVKSWTRAGCEVTVVCSDSGIDPDDTLLDGVDHARLKVIRCKAPSSLLSRIMSRLGRQLLVADGMYLLAWHLLDSILKTQIGYVPDVVVTSSAPYEVHFVGMALKRMFGFKWVADFRDPYTLNYHYKKINPISRSLDRRFERKIYECADGIIFNTNRNRLESCQAFGLQVDDPRFLVCQNGYDSDDRIDRVESMEGMPFIISYIGGVRGASYEQEFVAMALQNLSFLEAHNVVIRLIGNGSECFRADAVRSAGRIELVGFCSQAQLQQYWRSSHALLLLLPPAERYLGWVPQKVYMYLSSGRRILAMIPDGEAREYLSEEGRHVIREPGNKDFQGMIAELLNVGADSLQGHPHVERFSQKQLFGNLLTWLRGIAAT